MAMRRTWQVMVACHELTSTSQQSPMMTLLLLVLFPGLFAVLLSAMAEVSAVRGNRNTVDTLRQSQMQLQATIDAAVDGIISIDEQGLIVYFNPAATKIFGYAPEEIIGRKLHLLMPPEYHQQHDDYLRKYLKTGVKTVIGIGRELTGLRKDGTIFPLDLALIETAVSGQRIFTGFVRDITERKRAEAEILRLNHGLQQKVAELEALFAVLPIGVGVAGDRECTHICANPVLRKMLALPPEGNASQSGVQVGHVKFHLPNHGRELTPAELPMQTAARTGMPILNAELELVHQSGLTIPIAASAAPLLDEAGMPCGAVGVIWDLTDFKRAESLKRAADAAEASNRAKDEFLAMISHDLRTPISAILLTTTVMQRDGVPQQLKADIRQIEELAKTQLRLIEDILDATRILHGKLKMRAEPVDLHKVVHDFVIAVQPDAQGEQIDIVVEGDGDAGSALLVMGDALRLQQVGWNLVNNAVKFSPRGSTIRVRLGRDGSNVWMQVVDQGAGIPAEMLPRVFDRLSQGGGTSNHHRGGLGLGLYIVKHIVAEHRGTVRAESDGVGKGSTFTVTLPLLNSV